MSLTHHDSRPYEEAASAAAKHARTKLDEQIENGKRSATALIERIQRDVPQDSVVSGKALTFSFEEGPLVVHAKTSKATADWNLHQNALNQLSQKFSIPKDYITFLQGVKEPWGKKHLLESLTIHAHNLGKKYLVRSVNGQARAFLSDTYKPLDCRPILDAFVAVLQGLGAVPVEGIVTDTRMALKAVLPTIYEPVPNEVMCLGVELYNSDFGCGKLGLRPFIDRLWCTNLARMEEELARVHLGRQLPEDLELSKETYHFDTQTVISTIRDVTKACLGEQRRRGILSTIRDANEKEMAWVDVSKRVQKFLLKKELEQVKDAFEGPDMYNLPKGKTLWRASNALSWIANASQDQERKLELEKFAGELLSIRKAA